MDLDEDTLELVAVGTDGPGSHACTITVKQDGVATKEVKAKKDSNPRAEKAWKVINQNMRGLGFSAEWEVHQGDNKISYLGVIQASWDLR